MSSSFKTIQGCRKEFIGSMKYIAVSAPDFYKKYFRSGISKEALSKAPSILFNRSDNLLKQFLKGRYDADFNNIPVNYIPSYETFIHAVVMQLGYGIVPEIQAEKYIKSKTLINMCPEHFITIDLYWHCWNIDSLLIKNFTSEIISKSAAFLLK